MCNSMGTHARALSLQPRMRGKSHTSRTLKRRWQWFVMQVNDSTQSLCWLSSPSSPSPCSSPSPYFFRIETRASRMSVYSLALHLVCLFVCFLSPYNQPYFISTQSVSDINQKQTKKQPPHRSHFSSQHSSTTRCIFRIDPGTMR